MENRFDILAFKSLCVPLYIVKKVKHSGSYVKNGNIRNIFSRQDTYDEKDSKSIAEIKNLLIKNSKALPNIFKKQLDSEILRFLYAHDFLIEKTYQIILEHFDWLSNENNFKLNENSFKLLQNGTIYLANCDYQLRPIIIVDTMKINYKIFELEFFLTALYTLLNIIKTLILVPGYIENWLILIDLSGFFQNEEIIDKLIQKALNDDILSLLCKNYPNYLEKLYLINVPTPYLELLNTELIIISSKLIVLSKEETYKLPTMIEATQLEMKYGGKAKNLIDFWPPKNMVNLKILNIYHKNREKNPYFTDFSCNKNLRISYSHHHEPRKHEIFYKILPKTYLLDDLDSYSSNSSMVSSCENPLNSLKPEFFEEDCVDAKTYKTDQSLSGRIKSYVVRKNIKKLCQSYYVQRKNDDKCINYLKKKYMLKKSKKAKINDDCLTKDCFCGFPLKNGKDDANLIKNKAICNLI